MPGGGPIPRHDGERFYSPLVRSIARVEGVSVEELAAIRGSGRDGRVTKDDLTAYVAARAAGARAAVRALLPARRPALPGTARGARRGSRPDRTPHRLGRAPDGRDPASAAARSPASPSSVRPAVAK